MSTQITVRIPDDLVAFMDEQVSAGSASSRATLVARAVERERRRAVAEQDASIYATSADDADLSAFAAHAADHSPALD